MKEHPGILLRRRNAPAKLKLPSFNWKERSAQLTLAAMIAAGSVAGLVSAVWPSAVLPDAAQPAAPARVHDDMQSKLPESAPVSAPAPAAQSQTHTHIVLAGETLSGIAAKYNVDVATLLSANPQAGEMIYPGDQLTVLPERGVLHVVEAGDTLWGLANQYNVTTEAIMNANKRHDDRLAVGEKLIFPADGTVPPIQRRARFRRDLSGPQRENLLRLMVIAGEESMLELMLPMIQLRQSGQQGQDESCTQAGKAATAIRLLLITAATIVRYMLICTVLPLLLGTMFRQDSSSLIWGIQATLQVLISTLKSELVINLLIP